VTRKHANQERGVVRRKKAGFLTFLLPGREEKEGEKRRITGGRKKKGSRQRGQSQYLEITKASKNESEKGKKKGEETPHLGEGE